MSNLSSFGIIVLLEINIQIVSWNVQDFYIRIEKHSKLTLESAILLAIPSYQNVASIVVLKYIYQWYVNIKSFCSHMNVNIPY